ncbi:MAG TPA: hypothetical protein VHL98_18675 [Microvirga sp.]|nr:hypothetical protein [Microvirga sp.]
MPLFHFDVRYDGEPWSDDQIGMDLAGPEEARPAALELLAELAKDKLGKYDFLAVRIRDGQPEPVLTLNLSLRAEERL